MQAALRARDEPSKTLLFFQMEPLRPAEVIVTDEGERAGNEIQESGVSFPYTLLGMKILLPHGLLRSRMQEIKTCKLN